MPEQQQEENMNSKTKNIVGIGVLTAVVIVLQAMAVGIRFGIFNVTLVLAPIIIGAALYGYAAGAWLGFVFGVVVLFTDAGAFLAVSVPGTIITCILKGVLAGLAAGAIYLLLEKKSKLLAVIVAGVVCPIVNTGVFLLGCVLFFMDTINGWASALGYESAGAYLIFGMVGINFIFEMIVNLVLSSVIVQLIKIGRRS